MHDAWCRLHGTEEHVTRHTSRVTHTSHITHHTSHVTRHTSHMTRHTSHVTRHTLIRPWNQLPKMKKIATAKKYLGGVRTLVIYQ